MSDQTFRQCYPVCPHCGHELDDDEMIHQDVDLYALAPMEDSACIQCPLCDLEYWVKGGYQPHYTTAFVEDELL